MKRILLPLMLTVLFLGTVISVQANGPATPDTTASNNCISCESSDSFEPTCSESCVPNCMQCMPACSPCASICAPCMPICENSCVTSYSCCAKRYRCCRSSCCGSSCCGTTYCGTSCDNSCSPCNTCCSSCDSCCASGFCGNSCGYSCAGKHYYKKYNRRMARFYRSGNGWYGYGNGCCASCY